MAFSQLVLTSPKRKQVAMVCQLCENRYKLKWKCMECKLIMCQRCRDKVHPKFQSANDHTIIDIKDIGKKLNLEQKSNWSKLKCAVHSEHIYCLYCKTCSVPVCKTCIAKTHVKHEFIEISDDYHIESDKFEDGQNYFKQEIQSHTIREQGLIQSGLSNDQTSDSLILQDGTKTPSILGKMAETCIPVQNDNKMKTKFQTHLNRITNIASCSDGSLWICDKDSKTAINVKPNGSNLDLVSKLEIKVVDVALFPSGALLLSVVGYSNLKLIPSGSYDIINSVYKVTPLLPTAIHVTRENKILVGAVDTCDIPVTGPRQVIVMDPTGHRERVFMRDNLHEPLFTIPFRICSNNVGNIAVIDMISKDNKGRVVILDILDEKGDVRNIYMGHPNVNHADNPFIPLDITATSLDQFVLADTGQLHILNSAGEIITFYNTKEMGILLPYSLSFDAGRLYIGCDTYKNSKDKAKLFKIDNFPF